MTVPAPTDPVWRDILLGNVSFTFESLALKILLSRLMLEIKYDKSDEILNKTTKQLHNFFVENVPLESVKRDLAKITTKEVK
jgi:hypothetical protein